MTDFCVYSTISGEILRSGSVPDEETALQLLQSISALEKEYDVQLLTDADKDKIENLS